MRNRYIQVICAIGVMCFLTQCALMETVMAPEKPVIRMQAARIKEITFDTLLVEFDVGVLHSNNVDVTSTGVSYAISVFDMPLTAGEIHDRIHLASHRETTVRVPVEIAYDDIFSLVSRAQKSADIPYTFTSTVGVALPIIGDTRIPVSHKGTLPMLLRPEISLERFDVQRLSLAGADLRIDLRVFNPNQLSFYVDALSYAVHMNGSHVLSGENTRSFTVPPGDAHTLALPVRIDFFTASSALIAALRGSDDVRGGVLGDIRLRTSHEMMPMLTVPFTWDGSLSPARTR